MCFVVSSAKVGRGWVIYLNDFKGSPGQDIAGAIADDGHPFSTFAGAPGKRPGSKPFACTDIEFDIAEGFSTIGRNKGNKNFAFGEAMVFHFDKGKEFIGF